MQEPANQNPSITSTPANPFEPGTASHAIWPQPFNLGAVIAEFSMVKQHGFTASGACVGAHLTNSQRRNIQRIRQDPHYADIAHQALGDQLAWVSKTDFGQVLLFHEPGQIMDCGDNITALGGMDDALAAKRIVALALHPEREWKSIRFTGRVQFLELAFREALDHNLPIHTTGDEQKAILAKIMAERAGGMGANSGPTSDPREILRELDDLPAQTVTRTAPKPMPVALPPASKAPESAPAQQQPQPVVGVTPMFLNLRERLQDRRFRPTVKTGPHAPTTPPKGGPKSP